MSAYPPGSCIASRYLVVGRPMVGGMGIVYLCEDLEEDRPVALKTFRPEALPYRAARDRFLREATHLRHGEPAPSGAPPPAEILQPFAPVIAAVVAGAEENVTPVARSKGCSTP